MICLNGDYTLRRFYKSDVTTSPEEQIAMRLAAAVVVIGVGGRLSYIPRLSRAKIPQFSPLNLTESEATGREKIARCTHLVELHWRWI